MFSLSFHCLPCEVSFLGCVLGSSPSSSFPSWVPIYLHWSCAFKAIQMNYHEFILFLVTSKFLWSILVTFFLPTHPHFFLVWFPSSWSCCYHPLPIVFVFLLLCLSSCYCASLSYCVHPLPCTSMPCYVYKWFLIWFVVTKR